MRCRAREVVQRLALITLGVLVALGLMEVGLQVGAAYTRLTGQGFPMVGRIAGVRRVLAVGDSNTYGFWLGDRSKAYPSAFESVWNAAPEHQKVQVLNVGVPGTNSSHLRNVLPRLMELARPEKVTIMVGGNDWWFEPESVEEGRASPGLLWRFSRLYRLLYMMRRSFQDVKAEVTLGRDEGGSRGTVSLGSEQVVVRWNRAATEVSGWAAALEDNLVAMASMVRRFGAEPIFLTYPSERGSYGAANPVIRAAAQKAGVTLVDLGPIFTARCPTKKCPELLFWDQHPAAEGHALAARVLAEHFR